MKNLICLLFFISFLGCFMQTPTNPQAYFESVRKAEIFITQEQYDLALQSYQSAFRQMAYPFGKDYFNAALAASLSQEFSERDQFLQQIIDRSFDYSFTESVFVGTYITESEWTKLVANRTVNFDSELAQKSMTIAERDQLFRPMYETHDDTINSNRIINLDQIFESSKSNGLIAQQELGFPTELRNQPYEIVFHHSAQRRSYDKSVIDLEPILWDAVQSGRFDPETAIYYLNFQNDPEKGRFEVFPTWAVKHPLLPSDLSQTVWLSKLTDAEYQEVNQIREKWMASSIEEIAQKASYLSESKLPFIFTSVRKSVIKLRNDLDASSALAQYQAFTMNLEKYQTN